MRIHLVCHKTKGRDLPLFKSTTQPLMRALPQREGGRLLPDLQSVAFSHGGILFEPGERIHYRYFPVNTVVSLLYSMRDGSTTEMGLVGSEGVLGVAGLLKANAGRKADTDCNLTPVTPLL